MDLASGAAGLFAIGLLFLFMLLSIPVFVSMGLAAFIGFAVVQSPDQALRTLGQIVWQSSSVFELVAIPLFIFSGLLADRIDAGRDLFDVSKVWVGRIPNSLGVATIFACGVFAAITGSSLATAATVGVVSIPLLRTENYSRAQAGGFVAAGGTLGALFPPSIALILYGVITETSIGQLFMAGIVPGLIMMSLFAVWVIISRPRIVEKSDISWRARWRTTAKGVGILLLPVMIVTAIYTGAFTPSEVASLAVAYVCLLGLVQRRLTLGKFIDAGVTAMRITSMLFMLIVFGQYVAHFMVFEQVPQEMAQWVMSFHEGAIVTVGAMIVVYILLGVFLESLAMLLVSVPIFFPVSQAIGFHPITFGVFACIALEIAQIHPPFGVNLFTIHGISKISIWELAKGTFPFLLIQVAMLYVIYFFPELSLWIPQHMMGR